MRSMLALTLAPLALSAALLASACSTPAPARQTFPSASDLAVPPKPQPTIETLTSAEAGAEHNSKVEGWGDGMAAQLGRLCRYFDAKGMPGLTCPRPPADP